MQKQTTALTRHINELSRKSRNMGLIAAGKLQDRRFDLIEF